mmetsp:Transcript_71918/g.135859  ORF Transcript_71918/g.135859 Transcript_71918/m.135859 type:complete len:109 (+) Transcript_71918:959-1285(+)
MLGIDCVGVTVVSSQAAPTQTTQRNFHVLARRMHALSVAAVLISTNLAIECVGVTLVTSRAARTETNQRNFHVMMKHMQSRHRTMRIARVKIQLKKVAFLIPKAVTEG